MRFCQLRLNDVIARWPCRERVRALAEARPAPRLPDPAADRAEDLGDRFAAEPRIGPLDLAPDAAGSRKDRELAFDPRRAERPRGAQHERGLQQIVVAAVGAGANHRLVEREALARDLVGRKRVARAERLGDHRLHGGQVDGLVDLV